MYTILYYKFVYPLKIGLNYKSDKVLEINYIKVYKVKDECSHVY